MLPAGPAQGRARRLKLLFLLPFAPDLRGSHGGARATAAMIEMLSREHSVRGVYIHTAGERPPRQPPNCEQLIAVPLHRSRVTSRSVLRRVVDAFARLAWRQPWWVEECRSPALASKIAEIARQFEPDIVQFEFHVMAQYIPIVRSAQPNAKCVVTEHEPGISADARAGAARPLAKRLGALVRRRAWSRYESRALRRADGIVAFTAADAATLRRLLGPRGPAIAVIPLRLPQSATRPVTSPRIASDFLFVGNFGHPPNVDAALRLVGSIFPRILHQLPNAMLAIVGADPPRELLEAASDRVTVTGWVDDPKPYLNGARLVLVPLRQGGGLRVKMLEACAAGKAIIASPTAVEGLGLVPDQSFVLADSDQEFAQAAVQLFGDSARRSRLGKAARRWSAEAQDQDAWGAEYAALYDVLDRSRTHAAAARPR